MMLYTGYTMLLKIKGVNSLWQIICISFFLQFVSLFILLALDIYLSILLKKLSGSNTVTLFPCLLLSQTNNYLTLSRVIKNVNNTQAKVIHNVTVQVI